MLPYKYKSFLKLLCTSNRIIVFSYYCGFEVLTRQHSASFYCSSSSASTAAPAAHLQIPEHTAHPELRLLPHWELPFSTPLSLTLTYSSGLNSIRTASRKPALIPGLFSVVSQHFVVPSLKAFITHPIPVCYLSSQIGSLRRRTESSSFLYVQCLAWYLAHNRCSKSNEMTD